MFKIRFSKKFTSAMLLMLATSFSSKLVRADQIHALDLLDKYIACCQWQSHRLQHQSDWVNWKLELLSELKNSGHASWIELEKQRCKRDCLELRQAGYAKYLHDLDQIRSQFKGQYSETATDGLDAVRVSLPSAFRVVGWIEGVPASIDSIEEQLQFAKSELEALDGKMKQAKRLALGTAIDASPSVRKKIELKLAAAELDWQCARAQVDYLAVLRQCVKKPRQMQKQEAEVITGPSGDHVDSILANLVVSEAKNTQSIQILDLLIDREKQRLASMNQMVNVGSAAQRQIDQLQQHIDRLQSQHLQLKSDHELLDQLARFHESDLSMTNDRWLSDEIGQWPSGLFNDLDHWHYWIDLRHRRREAEVQISIAERQTKMRRQILERLPEPSVGKNVESADRWQQQYLKFQTAERETQQWNLRLLELSIAADRMFLEINRLEELRFLSQVEQRFHSSRPALEALTVAGADHWLSGMLMHNPFDKPEQSMPFANVKYVESNLFEILGSDVEFVMTQTSILPLGPFAADREQIRLQPLSFDRGRQANYRTTPYVSRGIGPNYPGTIGRNYRGRDYQSTNRSIAAPSLYNSPFATDQYRRDQIVNKRYFDRAYPFGILRSDLRRFQTPAQPPWYLPGWPGNIRYGQLDIRAGGNSSTTLKSRNYQDFSRPDFGN